ncbi:MAG: hypothetical protein ACR2LQ_11625 [Acidimicrobiales bacterium]
MDAADDNPRELDRRKIRLGLAMVSVVVVIAVAMFFIVEAPAGKALMFAIALTAFVRAYLLSRRVRTGE